MKLKKILKFFLKTLGLIDSKPSLPEKSSPLLNCPDCSISLYRILSIHNFGKSIYYVEGQEQSHDKSNGLRNLRIHEIRAAAMNL